MINPNKIDTDVTEITLKKGSFGTPILIKNIINNIVNISNQHSSMLRVSIIDLSLPSDMTLILHNIIDGLNTIRNEKITLISDFSRWSMTQPSVQSECDGIIQKATWFFSQWKNSQEHLKIFRYFHDAGIISNNIALPELESTIHAQLYQKKSKRYFFSHSTCTPSLDCFITFYPCRRR